MKKIFIYISLWITFFSENLVFSASDYNLALRRAQYLLMGTIPTVSDLQNFGKDKASYESAVRTYINSENFYQSSLRFHQKLFGVGLPNEYIEELFREDLDNKHKKVATILCNRAWGENNRFTCFWESQAEWRTGKPPCTSTSELPAQVFWSKGTTAWVCPSVLSTCGADLSQCLVRYYPEDEAVHSELGASEIFDSRFAIINSLGKQSAGLAASIVYENYPYTMLLEPNVTAIDGTIAHFLKQQHHFNIQKLGFKPEAISAAKSITITDNKFNLLKVNDASGNTAGILSTFGWLRRYSKNRTRANELYERLLCRKFASELPKVFPADPGNLREKEGCAGCHSTLDPLADFFLGFGEGGDLYTGGQTPVNTYFNAQYGTNLTDLANIIRNDQAFATCTAQNVFKWLVGRQFHQNEDSLRSSLAQYLIATNYSFKELVYAVVTHPVFTDSGRSDAQVSNPLSDPVMGTFVGEVIDCSNGPYTFAAHIEPYVGQCNTCHDGVIRSTALTTETDWQSLGTQSLSLISISQMPPGQGGTLSTEVLSLRNNLHCWLEANP